MTWTLPSNLNARRELLSEVFYRLKVSDNLEFSPDLQFLHHPSLRNQVNSTVLMGARRKVIF